MEDLTLQQLIDLQNIQKELNSNKDTYLKTYRQVLKKKCRTELNNLVREREIKNLGLNKPRGLCLQVRADFNIVESELNVPSLPPLPAEDEKTTSTVVFSNMVKDYDFTMDCLSLL